MDLTDQESAQPSLCLELWSLVLYIYIGLEVLRMNKRNKKSKAVSKVPGRTKAFIYFDPCYFNLRHSHSFHNHCCC